MLSNIKKRGQVDWATRPLLVLHNALPWIYQESRRRSNYTDRKLFGNPVPALFGLRSFNFFVTHVREMPPVLYAVLRPNVCTSSLQWLVSTNFLSRCFPQLLSSPRIPSGASDLPSSSTCLCWQGNWWGSCLYPHLLQDGWEDLLGSKGEPMLKWGRGLFREAVPAILIMIVGCKMEAWWSCMH